MLSRSLAATSNHIVGLPIGVPLCRRLSALLAALWLPVLVGPGISPTGGRFETVQVVAPAGVGEEVEDRLRACRDSSLHLDRVHRLCACHVCPSSAAPARRPASAARDVWSRTRP